MKQQETGYPLVLRFDELASKEECVAIANYVFSKKNQPKESNNETLPWHQSDTIAYNQVDDQLVKDNIKKIKYAVSELASKAYGQTCFPHFSDLVLWREGKKMWWHKDNGYEQDKGSLKPRIFSSICYINDDYDGGETLVKQGEEIYTSTPKQGSVLIFTSDERCEHRVTEVTKGNRITLAMWFSTEEKFKERD